jgi:hypothetical protein
LRLAAGAHSMNRIEMEIDQTGWSEQIFACQPEE